MMMKKIGLGQLAERKISILRELKSIKNENPHYKIIDVGGAKEKHCSDLTAINPAQQRHA